MATELLIVTFSMSLLHSLLYIVMYTSVTIDGVWGNWTYLTLTGRKYG
jgi:hypothetical protein